MPLTHPAYKSLSVIASPYAHWRGNHAQTRKRLAALTRHPNAGAVLVLSLGCENLTHEQEDLEFLAQSAYTDACAPGNPKEASVEDMKALIRQLM